MPRPEELTAPVLREIEEDQRVQYQTQRQDAKCRKPVVSWWKEPNASLLSRSFEQPNVLCSRLEFVRSSTVGRLHHAVDDNAEREGRSLQGVRGKSLFLRFRVLCKHRRRWGWGLPSPAQVSCGDCGLACRLGSRWSLSLPTTTSLVPGSPTCRPTSG